MNPHAQCVQELDQRERRPVYVLVYAVETLMDHEAPCIAKFSDFLQETGIFRRSLVVQIESSSRGGSAPDLISSGDFQTQWRVSR